MKYIPEGKYLLSGADVKMQKKVVKKDELEPYIKQKPNREILGFKFHMFLYNISSPKKNNWFSNYFRKIGEEPVVWDSYLTYRTRDQLKLFLKHKGYYNAKVEDTVMLHKRKADVTYFIKPGMPYKINKVFYEFEDTSLRKIILEDTIHTIIKPGENLDVDLLQAERERIERFLRERGYYKFNKEYIFYNIDTAAGNYLVNVEILIKQYQSISTDTRFISGNHPRYKINNVYIFSNYDPKSALKEGSEYFRELDTIKYDELFFVNNKKSPINPGILAQSNYIIPSEYYDELNVDLTKRHLNSLKAFKLIDISFSDVKTSTAYYNTNHLLNCDIQLTPLIPQSFQFELQGTNTSGNIGGAGNLVYQHRNLFGNVEILNISLRGSAETLFKTVDSLNNNTTDVGIEARITLPKFLLPFKTESFIKRYSPKTSLVLSYNFRDRPEYYKRTLANFTFGYSWRGNRYLSHLLNPVKLNLVSLENTTELFRDLLQKTPYLRSTYESRLIAVSDYSLIFTNQDIQKNRDFIFFRYNIESAGNSLFLAHRLFNKRDSIGGYKLFGEKFSQYIKTDFDFRYYNVRSPENQLVYRVFAGIAYPYENSNSIPFEKKYFSGGANSIRAWQPRFVGPGSVSEQDKTYISGVADIKLEFNIEYRFKLFWLLEGALFLDGGNIWALNESDPRPGANFDIHRFYKEIALGAGFGARFDLSFFIVRFDAALQVFNPANYYDELGNELNYLEGEKVHKWLFNKDRIGKNDWAWHFAIAYPF